MGPRERMKRGSGMKDRDKRSRGIVTRIADAFAIIKPTAPFRLAKHEASKETKVVRFLWQLISQIRYFPVCMQEQEEDKFVIQPSSSVHCKRDEIDWVRTIQVNVPVIPDLNTGKVRAKENTYEWVSV